MIPAVTVGISVYNAAKTVRDAVRSVRAQTFTDWELLLVDDGSTDGSASLLEEMKGPRVQVWRDGANRGLAARLNQIAALARTPYLARMDADDLMHPERLERQIAYLRAHPEADLCGSAAYVMDERGLVYGVRGGQAWLTTAGIRAGFLHPTVTGRTEWFRGHPYDPAYNRAEDLELWQRASEETVCFRLPEPLMFYYDPLRPQAGKYRASCRTERRILWDYSRPRMGAVRTAMALTRVFVKEYLHLACSAAGLGPALVKRRNRVCTAEEIRDAKRALMRIAAFETAN